MNTNIFRIILIGSFVLGIVGALIDLIFSPLLPARIGSAYDAWLDAQALGGGTLFYAAMAVSFLIVVATLVAVVGLCCFQRWARTLALVTTVVSYSISPFLGPMVLSGLAGGMVLVATFSWGLVLALAYYSPLAMRFEP